MPVRELVRVARTSRTNARFNTSHVVGSYNIAPTSNLPVVVHKSCPHYTTQNLGEQTSTEKADVPDKNTQTVTPTTTSVGEHPTRQLTLLNWGWPEYKLINCRGEELQEKPLFVPHLNGRRCVVVVQGVFEWTPDKQPYKYEPKPSSSDSETELPPHMFLAGLYNHHGHVILLTTEANEYLGKVHHRMPVFLSQEEIDDWIDPNIPFNQVIKPVLDLNNPKWDRVICSPVTKLVNNLQERSAKTLITIDEWRQQNKERGGSIQSFFGVKPNKNPSTLSSTKDTPLPSETQSAQKTSWFASSSTKTLADTQPDLDAVDEEMTAVKHIEPAPELVKFVESSKQSSLNPESFFCPSQTNSPNAKALNEASNPKSIDSDGFRIKLRKVLPGTKGLSSELEREELREWVRSKRRQSRGPRLSSSCRQLFDGESPAKHTEAPTQTARYGDSKNKSNLKTKPEKFKGRGSNTKDEIPLHSTKHL